MDKRFPLQLELVNRLLSRETPDGCDLDALREEMGEVVVYALFFSSPEMEKDLDVLLKAANQHWKKRRELVRWLRRPRWELERLGISRRKLTEKWALLRQQLEDSGQLEQGLRQFGEGHVPEEEFVEDEGTEVSVTRTPFRGWERTWWERTRWESDPETAPHDYSEEGISDGGIVGLNRKGRDSQRVETAIVMTRVKKNFSALGKTNWPRAPQNGS